MRTHGKSEAVGVHSNGSFGATLTGVMVIDIGEQVVVAGCLRNFYVGKGLAKLMGATP